MNFSEAEEKYLNKFVRHKTHGWEFEIINSLQLGSWAKEPIEFIFKVRALPHNCVPSGMPGKTTLQDLETNYEFIE